MSLSLSPGSDRLFAPLGRRQQLVVQAETADELDRDGQAVSRETDRERDRRQTGVAPGGIEGRIAGRRGIGSRADRRGVIKASSSSRCRARP